MPALSRRPAGVLEGTADLFTWFVRARVWYFSLPRLQFEAMTFGITMLVGLLVMPMLIYLAGLATLKPYAHGGVFSLYYDWFKGLVGLVPSFWIVLIGPYAFLSVFRLFRLILRKV